MELTTKIRFNFDPWWREYQDSYNILTNSMANTLKMEENLLISRKRMYHGMRVLYREKTGMRLRKMQIDSKPYNEALQYFKDYINNLFGFNIIIKESIMVTAGEEPCVVLESVNFRPKVSLNTMGEKIRVYR